MWNYKHHLYKIQSIDFPLKLLIGLQILSSFFNFNLFSLENSKYINFKIEQVLKKLQEKYPLLH